MSNYERLPVRYSVHLEGGRHYSFEGGYKQHRAIVLRNALRGNSVRAIYSNSTSAGKPFATETYMRDDRLRLLAEHGQGVRYDDPRWKAIADLEDWSEFWPVVNSDGVLTGEIVDSQEGYWNVDDLAMIAESELSVGMIAENGGMDAIREVGYVDLMLVPLSEWEGK